MMKHLTPSDTLSGAPLEAPVEVGVACSRYAHANAPVAWPPQPNSAPEIEPESEESASGGTRHEGTAPSSNGFNFSLFTFELSSSCEAAGAPAPYRGSPWDADTPLTPKNLAPVATTTPNNIAAVPATAPLHASARRGAAAKSMSPVVREGIVSGVGPAGEGCASPPAPTSTTAIAADSGRPPQSDLIASWVADVIFENGGVMTSANLGSTLASSNEARYHTIKATFGGLCGLLSRFPERFVLVNNPPLNHVVALGRASASSRQAGGARHGASRGGGLPAERRGASPSNLGLALAGTSAGSPPGARGAQGGRSAQGSAPALGGGEPTLGGGASASAALVEREIVRCTHDILAHARDHSLKAVELANALRARVGVEALSRVREQHGGLLSLLEHHPQTFAVRRVPKHDSIALVVPPAFRAAAAPRGGDVGDPAGCAPPSWPTAPPTSNAADAAVNSPVLPPPPPHHAHYMGRHPRQAHYDAAAIGCGADGYGVPRSWSPPTSAQPHAATRPPGAVLGPAPASVFIDSHGHQHWSSGALAAPAAAPELSQFAQYRCSQPLADSDTTAVVATQSSSSSLSSHSRSPASLSPPLTADAAAYSPPLHTTAPPHPEPSPHFAPPQFLAAGGGADGGTTSSPFSAMPGAVVGESSQHATRAHGGALALLMNENYVPTKAWPVGALPAGEDDALVCVVAELLHAQHGAATLTKLRALLKQHFGLLTSVKSVPLRSFLAAHAYRFATEGTHVTLRQ